MPVKSNPRPTRKNKRKGVEAAKNAKPKEPEIESPHALLSSEDPKNHARVLKVIEHDRVDVNSLDAEGNTLLQLAVKNEALSVIEALLLRNRRLDDERRNAVALIMRSPNVADVLGFVCRRGVVDFNECCDHMPWDTQNHHFAKVVTTLVQAFPWNVLRLAQLIFRCRTKENERSNNFRILLSAHQVLNNPPVISFLVGEGANINDRVNGEQENPLHLACRYCEIETVRLFLRMGADANAADRFGNTPLSISLSCGKDFLYDEQTKLVIKEFGRLTRAGESINERDFSTVRSQSDLREFYESCVEELDRMKTVRVTEAFSYYGIFSKTSHELSLLMRNHKIFDQLRSNLKTQLIFPIFKADLIRRFGVAREMRDLLVSRELELGEIFRTLPSLVIRKISRDSLDLENFEKEYHATKWL